MADKSTKAIVDLIVNGKSAMASVNDYGKALKIANKELREMKQLENESPAAYAQRRAAKLRETAMIRSELMKQKEAIKEVKSSWSQFVSGSSKIAAGVFGGNIAMDLLNRFKDGVVALIGTTAKLSDELADVSKATGMNTEEVNEFNDAIQKIDTRTKFDELRKIAEIGGRFGVVKEDIDEFTESTDKLNVAFGDQFDSVEQLTDQTLKMRNIFLDIKSDDIGGDILHIGNAMNVLEQQGAATGKGMADFASRIGGVAIPLGFTSGQVLGLSAALEELNVTPERGATAVNTILQKMLTGVHTFAEIARMDVKEFEHLLNTDLFGAFMRVVDGAKQGGDSATKFAAILADAKLEGAGASEIFLKLSSSQEMVAEKVATATSALQENGSIMNEFNIKNQNAAAIIEKMSKMFEGMWEKAAASLNPVIIGLGKMLGVVSELDLQMGELSVQQDKFLNAESKLPTLTDRYDQLRLKSSLTKEEQAEMKKIMEQIAEIVPSAAFEFDKYGNVMQVDTDIARKYLTEQRGILEAMRQQRKEMLEREANMLSERVRNLQRDLNQGFSVKVVDMGMGQFQEQRHKLVDSEIKTMRKQLADYQAEVAARRDDLKNLGGGGNKPKSSNGGKSGPLSQAGKPEQPGAPSPLSSGTGGSEGGKKKDKELKEQEKFFSEMLDRQQKYTVDSMEGHEKELQEAQYFYEEMRKKAKGNAKELEAIATAQVAEIQAINEKYNTKFLNQFDSLIRGDLGEMNEAAEARNKFYEEQKNAEAVRVEGESAAIRQKYQRQIEEARQNGYDTITLYSQMAAELAKLQQENAAEEIEEYTKKEQKKRDEDKKTANNKKKSAQEELQQMDMIFEGAATVTDAIGNVFAMSSKNQERSAQYQKTIGMVQIAIDSARAITGAIAASTAGDPYTLFIRIATAIATVTSGIMKAKQLMKGTDVPAAPAYADGGFTDMATLTSKTGGYFGRATMFSSPGRQFIAGEKGREFITSHASLQYPAIAAYSEMINAAQQSQNYQAFGQLAMQGSGSATVAPRPFVDPRVDETNQLLREVVAGIGQGWNYRELEKFKKKVDDVRARTSV